MAGGPPPPLSKRVGVKLTKWLLVTVLLGSLPILFKLLFAVGDGDLTLETLIGEGELFLVAAGFGAAGVGELFFRWRGKPARSQTRHSSDVAEGVAVIASILVVAIAAGLYGRYETADPGRSGGYLNTREMVISVVLFLASIIASVACVIVAERRDSK